MDYTNGKLLCECIEKEFNDNNPLKIRLKNTVMLMDHLRTSMAISDVYSNLNMESPLTKMDSNVVFNTNKVVNKNEMQNVVSNFQETEFGYSESRLYDIDPFTHLIKTDKPLHFLEVVDVSPLDEKKIIHEYTKIVGWCHCAYLPCNNNLSCQCVKVDNNDYLAFIVCKEHSYRIIPENTFGVKLSVNSN